MILYTITKLSMPRIDQIINNENKWIFYDNKFSQFMVFNEDAIVSNKSLISKLTPGDVEHFIRGLSSMLVKKSYVSCFASLWIFARKRGWLGTNP